MLPFVPASFGDIVAAANIALSIYKALSDSTGSSYEYQCLIAEVHSFEQALRTIDIAIAKAPPTGQLAQDIGAETTRCLELLKTFLGRIKSYQKALGGGGKGASWRKIGWGLFKSDEVASFRQKLSQHKQNITLFLNGLTIIVVASYADETKQVSASMNEGILSLQKRLPRSIGYGDGNSVTVMNVFGNPMTFPMELCFSADKLHETLTTYFKGKYGESHVERQDYSISTKDGRSLVQSSNWRSVVKKGTVLVMSVIVKKPALAEEEARRQRNTCPRCYKTGLGVMPDEGWLQCRRCERRFSAKDETDWSWDPPTQDNNFTEFRNIRVVLVERDVPVPNRLLVPPLPNPLNFRDEWHKAKVEEANRFVEIS